MAVAVAVAGTFSLYFAAGKSAAAGPRPIAVSAPAGGFTLPAPRISKTTPRAPATPVVPSSPPDNPLTLPFKGALSCPTRNGQAATCTALATLVAKHLGPLSDVPLATFAQTFSSGHPIQLVFGLSQRSVNLIYRYRDPRCTVIVAVVDDSSSVAQSIPTSIEVK